MTAKEAIKYLLDKVEPGEPVFIIRGRDELSVVTVSDWIDYALERGVNREKIEAAQQVRRAMVLYPVKRLPD